MGISSNDDRSSPDIGKIIVNKHTNKGSNKTYIIIFPDPNQTTEHTRIAKNWIVNNFQPNSKIKSGKISFPEEKWKKVIGNKFIQAAHDSDQFITWKDVSNDAKIMKGLSILQGSNRGSSFPSHFDRKDSFEKNNGGNSSMIPAEIERQGSASLISSPPYSEKTQEIKTPKENYLSNMKSLLDISENIFHDS